MPLKTPGTGEETPTPVSKEESVKQGIRMLMASKATEWIDSINRANTLIEAKNGTEAESLAKGVSISIDELWRQARDKMDQQRIVESINLDDSAESDPEPLPTTFSNREALVECLRSRIYKIGKDGQPLWHALAYMGQAKKLVDKLATLANK